MKEAANDGGTTAVEKPQGPQLVGAGAAAEAALPARNVSPPSPMMPQSPIPDRPLRGGTAAAEPPEPQSPPSPAQRLNEQRRRALEQQNRARDQQERLLRRRSISSTLEPHAEAPPTLAQPAVVVTAPPAAVESESAASSCDAAKLGARTPSMASLLPVGEEVLRTSAGRPRNREHHNHKKHRILNEMRSPSRSQSPSASRGGLLTSGELVMGSSLKSESSTEPAVASVVNDTPMRTPRRRRKHKHAKRKRHEPSTDRSESQTTRDSGDEAVAGARAQDTGGQGGTVSQSENALEFGGESGQSRQSVARTQSEVPSQSEKESDHDDKEKEKEKERDKSEAEASSGEKEYETNSVQSKQSNKSKETKSDATKEKESGTEALSETSGKVEQSDSDTETEGETDGEDVCSEEDSEDDNAESDEGEKSEESDVTSSGDSPGEEDEDAESEHEKGTPAEYRRLIADRLLHSERAFVQSMRECIEVFINPLLDKTNPNPLLNKFRLKNLFSNYRTEERVHAIFLEALERAMKLQEESTDPDYMPCFTDAFNLLVKNLAHIIVYVGNFPRSMATLDEVEKFPGFELFVQQQTKTYEERRLSVTVPLVSATVPIPLIELHVKQVGSNPKVHEQNVKSYLSLPIIRLQTYKDITADLLKMTPDTHPDKQGLDQFLQNFSVVMAQADAALLACEQHKKMMELIKNFDTVVSGLNFLTEYRRYLRDGTLTKICRTSQKKRHFILFNDILMYGNGSLAGFYLHRVMLLEGMQAHDAPDTKEYKDAFVIATPLKSFIVYADSLEEKCAWVKDINVALVMLHEWRRAYNKAIAEQGGIVASSGRSEPCATAGVGGSISFVAPPTNSSPEIEGGIPRSMSLGVMPRSPTLCSMSFGVPRSPTVAGSLAGAAAERDGVVVASPGAEAAATDDGAEVDMSDLPLSRTNMFLAPVFQSKKAASNCYICGDEFSLIIFRHYCKLCGKAICYKCSPNRMMLPNHPTSQRVCNRCYRANHPGET
eukprot:TRINITY_DN1350_c1_g1_i11.p1 TRINITY_DN1350_c1_g1~~TRINITY_DN1350_c1_g1_i11.p1  ORF type:complete len:1003 (-),score=235.68 TRINITY_DN1350_c1_g1_i11:89-3097(-)